MINKFLDPYILSGLAGGLLSILVLYLMEKKRSHDKMHMFVCCLFGIAGMFLGAHLLFFLVNLSGFSDTYGSSIYDIQSFFNAVFNAASGLVFYGGLFGAFAAILIFCKVNHLDGRSYLNAICCIFPLFHAFGRIGCLLGGCCYGIEYHGALAIQYTESQINPGISDHIADFPRFPVQLLEAVLELLIFSLLITIYLRTGTRYSIVSVYLFSYGIVRFGDEFLRGDTVRGIWGPFATSQWIALGCILGVLIYWFAVRQHTERNPL